MLTSISQVSKFLRKYSTDDLYHPLKIALNELGELSNKLPISATCIRFHDHTLYVVNGRIFNDIFKKHTFFEITDSSNDPSISCISFVDHSQLKSRLKLLSYDKPQIKKVNILDNSSVHVIVKSFDIDDFHFITDQFSITNIE